MTYTPSKILSFEDFLSQYGDDPRYELIDGELRDMEPTGPHESTSGKLAGRLFAEILRLNLRWTIPKNCLIRPPGTEATALRPDVIVLDEAELAQEPLWEKQPVLTSGKAIRLVAEVVSTNWQDDYARKVEDYAMLGIPEYWIVDFRGLGGIAFIGKPKQPTFTICQLASGEYAQQKYRMGEAIASPLFPELNLRLNDIMP
ncbi:Uma2 family endonuclease [Leptolyngbya sp. FACHB-711]|uniref:Uma2 family endonuclease n=1 Tax=unclassified Leptolyngbya TaxID=2650499 RepID=UPI0016852182|nr:Uma2 family endonuclease [Leptolyngbya sp. FACHB-711]MBD2028186.1 Uma2 family endonuclease [Leptolyngbya sp. FACHB-711]